MKGKCIAVMLAAGVGKRMNSSVAKQYMLLENKPVIWYGLQAFQNCKLVDEVILVVGSGEISYATEEIIQKYDFSKVTSIIEGGTERYLSVENALKQLANKRVSGDELILIQDGARPFLTEKLIKDTIEAAIIYGACCAAVPVKDTIRVTDEKGLAVSTPDRKSLFAVQTPQTFNASLILEAYRLLNEKKDILIQNGITITDDCMVVEQMVHQKIKIVEGDYSNIKITTPEDMVLAEQILRSFHPQSTQFT